MQPYWVYSNISTYIWSNFYEEIKENSIIDAGVSIII